MTTLTRKTVRTRTRVPDPPSKWTVYPRDASLQRLVQEARRGLSVQEAGRFLLEHECARYEIVKTDLGHYELQMWFRDPQDEQRRVKPIYTSCASSKRRAEAQILAHAAFGDSWRFWGAVRDERFDHMVKERLAREVVSCKKQH